MRRRIARASCHRASGGRDTRCNSSRIPSACAPGPRRSFKKPQVRKIERFLSDAEIASLARLLRTYEVEGGNPYISNAIRLLLLTGCRKNELLTLQWDQVDLD